MSNDDNDSNDAEGAKKESKPATAGGSIIDITHTPDVAVWAKEIRRGTDKVEQPSMTQSSTRPTTDEKLVDSADEGELAGMADRDSGLTDEADVSKNKDAD